MAKQKRVNHRKSSSTEKSQLNVVNKNTAGIDLGSKDYWVCVWTESTSHNIRLKRIN